MELRSRKRLAGDGTEGTEQREEEDGSRESGGGSDKSDVKDYGLIDPSDSDWDSALDSEGDDDQYNEEVVINLNDRPKENLKEPLRNKGKVEQKKKRGQPSSDEEVVDYGSFDELKLIPEGAVETDFLGLTGKSKRRKSRSGRRKPILMWNNWENEHNRWIDENFHEDFDLDVQNNVVNEVAETPSDLIMPLLRYQKEWLAWAVKQEV